MRRIPVREMRAKGWRTRVVEHVTESGCNPATGRQSAPKHDTLDQIAALIMALLAAGVFPEAWMADSSSASRRAAVKASQ